MKKFNRNLSFLTLAVAASFQAQADVRINGFANLTAGMTTEDVDLFGQGEDIDFSNASLFALQVSGDVAENITATAQIVARGAEDYSAEFEWAYLSYTLNDNSVLTAGRFRLPVFRYSASLDVGYSYHWISAPAAVYDVAFNNLNGIRYDYSNYTGDLEYVFQASYGNYEDEIAGGKNVGSDVMLLSAEGNYNGFKGRLVWGRGGNQFSSPTYEGAVAGVIAQITPFTGGLVPEGLALLLDDLAIDDDDGQFLGLGLEYDNFNWFISGEYTTVEIEDSFSAEDTAYYVTAGVRVGKWTPHITHQARDGSGDIKFTDRYAQIPAPFVPGITAFNEGLQTNFFEDYSITTVGVRYDAAANVALKAEVSKYDNKIESATATQDTTLLNISLNYVF